MPVVNNIFNIKILNISSGSSVNFGNNLLKGFTADSKSVGGSTVIGDASLSNSTEFNNANDSDVFDQPSSQI